MDRYMYQVIQLRNKRTIIHMLGNVYSNYSDDGRTNHRIAEWVGEFLYLDDVKEMLRDDTFLETLNEAVAYLDDLTEKEAVDLCETFFDGSSGKELDISLVSVDTPSGFYWYESGR